MFELPHKYVPQDVEPPIYKIWEEEGYFKADSSSKKPPFSIILPPPNVTGFLHMGHALDHTIQDTLVRWKRMCGFNTLWLPGSDHAGIATQTVVEKRLAKKGQSRQSMGRESFVEKIWEWKQEYGHRIYSQMRRLGNSVDWDRETFTLDEGVSRAVRRAFVHLYKKGWLYRGRKLVNWSPPLNSAISDLEVIHRETKGHLYHIAYPIVRSQGERIVIATTRPETYLADACVCVHPEDSRYQKWVGSQVELPLIHRCIPIIADSHVDPEFGTGALKVTPAHDFNDHAIGIRHHLDTINILDEKGCLNEMAGDYQGLSVLEARKRVVKDLEAQGFLVQVEPHTHSVGYCERTGAVVEPFLSEQWFVKTKKLSEPAQKVVQDEVLKWVPHQWSKTYLHWMDIIEDWCVSRQLWWGHRIPAWFCPECHHITVAEDTPSVCENCGGTDLHQDEDVLDTWFSSGLWPLSTLGWPESTSSLDTFYPTSILVTGHDIIFFWVARMIMLGLEMRGEIPFEKVYIHGLVRDSQGQKMSKSLGNSIDPVELIETHGADALRFTLLSQMATGKDLKFSIPRLDGYRNFMNKLWNAARFCMSHMKGVQGLSYDSSLSSPVSNVDRWIIYQTFVLEKEMNKDLEALRFSDATNKIYTFVWHEFCDWYLEFSKPILYGKNKEAQRNTQMVLFQTLNRILRLLHPFAPFITEKIYSQLPTQNTACIIDSYPRGEEDSPWLKWGSAQASFEIQFVKEVIMAVRNIRGENKIKPSVHIEAWIVGQDEKANSILRNNKLEIMRLAGLSQCHPTPRENLKKCAFTPVIQEQTQAHVIVPLEGLVDLDKEVLRLKKKLSKLQKDREKAQNKLKSENFLSHAPKDVVEAHQKLLETMDSKIYEIKEACLRLTDTYNS